ncbi:hypothetical protein [Tianweitania sediminis]|uniref:Uncharacterized protein n=1 Tax=Tianweitania sediminis TaxID=1502156 RepID=A0A8J7R6X2_9HYPH|nr:hypothetical protein [Tianweitania sediminis]MBP0439122.1 hypothetical protein [Tianweitania sediminis]
MAYHGNGGAPGAGEIAGLGGLIAAVVIPVMYVGIFLYVRLWFISLPATLLYCGYYHPAETWEFVKNSPWILAALVGYVTGGWIDIVAIGKLLLVLAGLFLGYIGVGTLFGILRDAAARRRLRRLRHGAAARRLSWPFRAILSSALGCAILLVL